MNLWEVFDEVKVECRFLILHLLLNLVKSTKIPHSVLSRWGSLDKEMNSYAASFFIILSLGWREEEKEASDTPCCGCNGSLCQVVTNPTVHLHVSCAALNAMTKSWLLCHGPTGLHTSWQFPFKWVDFCVNSLVHSQSTAGPCESSSFSCLSTTDHLSMFFSPLNHTSRHQRVIGMGRWNAQLQPMKSLLFLRRAK
jgi:hypothetical protein